MLGGLIDADRRGGGAIATASTSFRRNRSEKAEALGQNLAIKTVNALRSDKVWKNDNPRLAVGAKTIYGPTRGPVSFRDHARADPSGRILAMERAFRDRTSCGWAMSKC